MADILVVDDDQSVATAFRDFLAYEGHECRLASNAEEAVRQIAARPPALVMMDVRMPGVDGLQALRQMRELFPDVYVVMMTGYGTSQTSIDAIRAGALDYLTKPLDLDEIRGVIRKALAARQTKPADERTDAAEPRPVLIGDTPAMREVYKTIGRLAAIDVPALVVGEVGTGKRLVVSTIHENSTRRDQPFVTLDCASATDAAIDQALFQRSAGTVHLAAVDGLSPALQVRLAQALEHDRPRGAGPALLGCRIIASTEVDLAGRVANETFRRELHSALSLVTIALPPLRARRDDIPLLARHFVQRFNLEFDRHIKGLDDGVMQTLLEYAWPGNVSELERAVKRGCILARSEVVTTDDIGQSLSRRPVTGRRDAETVLTEAARTALQERLVDAPGAAGASIYHDIVDIVETALVAEALSVTNGNQVKAAAILGVNRATLRKKMPAEP